MRIDKIKRRGTTIELTGSFQREDLSKIVDLVNNRILGIHNRLAGDFYPDGVDMLCGVCGRTVAASSRDCAGYLAGGWPRCCGKEMRQQPTLPVKVKHETEEDEQRE